MNEEKNNQIHRYSEHTSGYLCEEGRGRGNMMVGEENSLKLMRTKKAGMTTQSVRDVNKMLENGKLLYRW